MKETDFEFDSRSAREFGLILNSSFSKPLQNALAALRNFSRTADSVLEVCNRYNSNKTKKQSINKNLK